MNNNTANNNNKLPAPSSTALQRLPSASGGSLSALPLRLCEDKEDRPLLLDSSSQLQIQCSVAGQTLKTLLPNSTGSSSNGGGSPMTFVAPLSHLYHAQLHVQVEDAQNPLFHYRGSYAVHQLPIHPKDATCIRIPLKLQTAAKGGGEAALTSSTNSNDNNTPEEIVLHVQCTLEGPCRPEIVTLQTTLHTWLAAVEKAEDVLRNVWDNMISPQLPQAAKKKQALLLLIPAFLSLLVPVAIGCILVSPVAIGICVLFFPIMIPLVVGICLVILASILATALITSLLYASTSFGRTQLKQWWNQQSTLQQYVDEIKGPRFGLQTFVYATGPRPTPVTLARTQMPTEKWRRLCLSLTIDGVGSFSYLLPFIGEAFDVVWAPTQTVLIMALYQEVSPNMSYVSFAEEMLPFLDVLPSATTGWVMEFGPVLMEDAKYVARNPSSVQRLLWGSSSTSQSTRRPPPTTTRPMRAS